MAHLSLEAREAIALQAINRGELSLQSIANNNNVGFSSLQRWIKQYKKTQPSNINNKANNKFTNSEKLQHLSTTLNLDDVSLGKYCREHGLYSHQLDMWREDFMKPKQEVNNSKQQLEIKKLKAENKQLQKDLRRKEKALAEASALLILKKKQT